jgi:hypothetical protein
LLAGGLCAVALPGAGGQHYSTRQDSVNATAIVTAVAGRKKNISKTFCPKNFSNLKGNFLILDPDPATEKNTDPSRSGSETVHLELWGIVNVDNPHIIQI